MDADLVLGGLGHDRYVVTGQQPGERLQLAGRQAVAHNLLFAGERINECLEHGVVGLGGVDLDRPVERADADRNVLANHELRQGRELFGGQFIPADAQGCRSERRNGDPASQPAE